MRLAICNETFSDRPLEEGFQLAADIGYAGIEIAPFTLSEDLGANAELQDVRGLSTSARERVKQAAERANLEIVGLHWLLAKTEGFHLTSPDASVRQRTSEYLLALAELCDDLGGETLVLGSPQQRNLLPGVTTEQAMAFAAETLGFMMPYLEEKELSIALEPLGPSEGNFLTTAASAVELIERIESTACRLHLDVKAMSSESLPIVDIVRENVDHLQHFHANDPNLLGPGMGEIEIKPILQSLQEIEYKGWVSVEVFKYEPTREEIARRSYRNLREALR